MNAEISRTRAFRHAEYLAKQNALIFVPGIRFSLGGVNYECKVLRGDVNDAFLLEHSIRTFSCPSLPEDAQITSELLHDVREQAVKTCIDDGRLPPSAAAFPAGTVEVAIPSRDRSRTAIRWVPAERLANYTRTAKLVQDVWWNEEVTLAQVIATRKSAREL